MCWGLSASSPVEKTPPESAEPQESAEPSSSSQESLPASDASTDTPQSDPDAWIQVEKRHRQPPGKAKVPKNSLWSLNQLKPCDLSILLFFIPFCLSSFSHPPILFVACRFHLFVSLFVSSTFRPAACQWWCVCCQLFSSLSAPTRLPPLCSWVLPALTRFPSARSPLCFSFI